MAGRSIVIARALWAMAVALVASSPAYGFVCERAADASGNDTGASLAWFKRDLSYNVNVHGTAAAPDSATLSAAIEQAHLTWQELMSQLECGPASGLTDITFARGPDSASTLIGFDALHPDQNENLIIFYDVRCQAPTPAGTPCLPSSWPGPTTIALTTDTYNPLTGEIFDSDLELDGVDNAFALLPAYCPSNVSGTALLPECAFIDIQNTVTHETGHFLGLAHTTVPNSTMNASAQRGETSKRTLGCDDRDGLLFKYPAGQANGYCNPPASACGFCAPPGSSSTNITARVVGTDSDATGGCQASAAPRWAAWLVLLALVFSPSLCRCGRRAR